MQKGQSLIHGLDLTSVCQTQLSLVFLISEEYTGSMDFASQIIKFKSLQENIERIIWELLGAT